MRLIKKYLGVFIEWTIAIVLIACCYYSLFSYGSFSPIKAHEQSERTYHYGPSKILKTIDLDGQKIYLCRYKDWFSANTVKKGILKWYPGDQVGGTPIDFSKQVSYSWSRSTNKKNVLITKVYGYVTDRKITTILLEDANKITTSKYDLDESRMFIFYWSKDELNAKAKYFKGVDSNGNAVYEEQIAGF